MIENLGGTNFDSNSMSQEFEVDALIEGALKELQPEIKKEKKEEKKFEGTPMEPQKEAPQPKEIKKEEAFPEIKPKEEDKGYENTFRDLKQGAIVEGRIAKIDPTGALIDIGYKSEGFIPHEELSPGLKVGDKIKSMIEKLENKEGYVVLSKKNADFEDKWKEAFDAFRTKKTLQAKVSGAVKGGLVVDLGGVRGFIPASQVSKRPEDQLEGFVGKTLSVKVIEINRRQSKIVLSNKVGAIEKEKTDNEKLFKELEAGQIRKGKVKSLKTFGAFVDLGGIEGLIHLSELSWKRVKNPSDVLKVGQDIDVFVLGVDQVNRKVSLGLKQLQQDPWAVASEKYKQGQTVKVKVLRLAKFGAFVEVEEGLEGLIHISELSKEKIETPDQAVKPGDIVEAKILRIIPDEQKVGLSIKEVLIEKEKSLLAEQKKEESKITIAEMIAEKERQKAEKEAEYTGPSQENEVQPEA